MVISSSGVLMDTLRKHSLLSSAQIAQVVQLAQGRCGDARSLAKNLVQRGWLSVYQVNELLDGHGHQLEIGPYHVLDRLGQGGLSAVYKARHNDTGMLVAIKMIKPEVFATSEGRQQFLQEVEAMARLDHPNIVQFCDADQWRDTYYFAMEYVEGTDLGKVVRLCGALPVFEACDYVRQAAVGLQHAYERNLVHRDIKPVNLFLTYESANAPRPAVPGFDFGGDANPRATMLVRPQIKILDWGLASLRNPKGAQPASDEPNGSILGTADYLSPEQARNANAVDIRGDLYSLGCTLYFLLTGCAPFPDGTLMQKIMQHQQAEPKPIATFRTDVPDSVVTVVKRLMAKRPEDRYQTPASLALALSSCNRRTSPAMPSGLGRLAPVEAAPSKGRDDTPLPPALISKPRP